MSPLDPTDLVKQVDGVLASIGLDWRARYEEPLDHRVEPELNLYRRGSETAPVGIQIIGDLYAVNEYEFDHFNNSTGTINRGLFPTLRDAAIDAAQALIDMTVPA